MKEGTKDYPPSNAPFHRKILKNVLHQQERVSQEKDIGLLILSETKPLQFCLSKEHNSHEFLFFIYNPFLV